MNLSRASAWVFGGSYAGRAVPPPSLLPPLSVPTLPREGGLVRLKAFCGSASSSSRFESSEASFLAKLSPSLVRSELRCPLLLEPLPLKLLPELEVPPPSLLYVVLLVLEVPLPVLPLPLPVLLLPLLPLPLLVLPLPLLPLPLLPLPLLPEWA